eukprot:5876915-Amphidinium_carterae.1
MERSVPPQIQLLAIVCRADALACSALLRTITVSINSVEQSVDCPGSNANNKTNMSIWRM